MYAVGHTKYGPPEVLRMMETQKPVPKDDEVLVRIHTATATAVDCAFRQGSPYMARLFTGLLRPKRMIPGSELAGVIEAVGSRVKQYQAGDRVFGAALGANAEYACIPEAGEIALMPEGWTFEQAAAVPYGALTALPFLRDMAAVGPGKQVLINGASGTIGTYAVQLARHYGAEVTGICSANNAAMVKSLGADTVIDYTREDWTRSDHAYDVIFDAVGKSSFTSCRRILKPGGVYLTTVSSASVLFHMMRTSFFGGKKAVLGLTGLRQTADRRKDLAFIVGLLEAGSIHPVIDRVYPFDQLAEAHRYVETGRKKGSVVIAVRPTQASDE